MFNVLVCVGLVLWYWPSKFWRVCINSKSRSRVTWEQTNVYVLRCSTLDTLVPTLEVEETCTFAHHFTLTLIFDFVHQCILAWESAIRVICNSFAFKLIKILGSIDQIIILSISLGSNEIHFSDAEHLWLDGEAYVFILLQSVVQCTLVDIFVESVYCSTCTCVGGER